MHGAGRGPARSIAHGVVIRMRRRSAKGRSAQVGRLMRRGCKGRAGHWSAGDGGDTVLLVHRGLRIHALLRSDVAQLRIVGWLLQVLRDGRGAGKVADQVQVLASRGGDAERLLHEAVGLVAIAVRSIIGRLVLAALEPVSVSPGGREAAAATLALHLTVSQEAA